MVAKAVESLIASYEKILNIREKLQGLRDEGIPDEDLERVKSRAENGMAEAVHKLADEIWAEHATDVPASRSNELRQDLEHALNAMANRIDRRFRIEVRGSLPGAPEEPEEGEEPAPEDARAAEIRRIAEIIAAMQPQLQFQKLEGKPILQLPEGDTEAADDR